MSFSALAGVFLNLSRLFLKICRWVLLKMSLNFKLSGFSGRLPANLKLKKSKEPLHGSNCVRKWRRKLLLLWILGVIIGFICFSSVFNAGSFSRKERTPDLCEEKARILLEHFNVSKNQLHSLVSLFAESDQVPCLSLLNLYV